MTVMVFILFFPVELAIPEKPVTVTGKLEVMARERTPDATAGQEDTSSGLQLTCGQFTNLGSPPVSVVWEVGLDGSWESLTVQGLSLLV